MAAKRARRVERKPDDVRRSTPVDPDRVAGLHRRLAVLRVRHEDPDEMDASSLRTQFVAIRRSRNVIQRIVSRLSPRLGQLRADASRIEAVIAAEAAELSLPTNAALDGCRNESQRKALLRSYLQEWYEAREDVRADLLLIEEVMTHAKWVREEMKYAFEETSRSLAAIEMDYKYER